MTFKNVLRIAAMCIFLGRAWQFIRWDAPFRTLLWDEKLMSGLVEKIGFESWTAYVTSSHVNDLIQTVITWNGYYFVLCAIAVMFYKYSLRGLKYIIYFGVFLLAILFMLETKERFYEMGMFFEHSVQLMTPLFFIWAVNETVHRNRLLFIMKCTMALCFTCHALYALGFPYFRPGIFVDMTINTFHISEKGAIHFLNTMGVLDIIASIALFFRKTEKIALYYMIAWGFISALDRTYAFYYPQLPINEFLGQYLHTTIYRLGHGLVPLAMYFLIKDRDKGRKIVW
ncbi:hypothetical protein UJ101_02208 [Flavobacteriaceae bacterium UJ101]|nr:hypothetical protein UJ101_02208 [Flavobacteriaceae bacterium UJ101]